MPESAQKSGRTKDVEEKSGGTISRDAEEKSGETKDVEEWFDPEPIWKGRLKDSKWAPNNLNVS